MAHASRANAALSRSDSSNLLVRLETSRLIKLYAAVLSRSACVNFLTLPGNLQAAQARITAVKQAAHS